MKLDKDSDFETAFVTLMKKTIPLKQTTLISTSIQIFIIDKFENIIIVNVLTFDSLSKDRKIGIT